MVYQNSSILLAMAAMGDVKDQIDFEFVGVELETAQSGLYREGVTDCESSGNCFHDAIEIIQTYAVDRQPDHPSWPVNGAVHRTLYENFTWTATDNQYQYPQSPSRAKTSHWPVVQPTNAPGTIASAGGPISWDGSYMRNGYYYAHVEEDAVECNEPPSGYTDTSDKAFYYTSTLDTNISVAIGNPNTELASFHAMSNQLDHDPDSKGSQSPSSPRAIASGLSDGGNQGLQGTDPVTTTTMATTSVDGLHSSAPTNFIQGDPSSEAATIVAGSGLALLGFFVVALML